MMLPRNLMKTTVGAITCLVVACTTIPSAYAAVPHENPETAEQIFSGISLFQYYSGSLDFVLKRELTGVEARLEKMPFANIPQELQEATSDFAASSISTSRLLIEIYKNLDSLRALMSQHRLEEAIQLADEIRPKFSRANQELEQIDKATKTTGRWFKVASASERSDLRKSYDEVLEKIDRIRQMLDLRAEILEKMLQGALSVEAVKPTSITLKVEPVVAFVGDNISFQGMLTSSRTGLSRREIDILIDGSPLLTVTTDASGYYQGTLQVPYQYMPDMYLQALYYPRDEDIGFYISSTSPGVTLSVLYYEANLEAIVEDKAYPGLETTVTGRFDYGQSPLPDERRVEIYLDDVLTAEVSTVEEFSKKIKLAPELDVGEHTITVSAEPAGRYAPVVASTILNVTRATPAIDITTSTVAVVPGRINLEGRLHSEVGVVSRAIIRMGLGKSQVELVSSEDGTFATEIKRGMGFDLIGQKHLEIQVIPQEPWHNTLTTTKNIVVINIVNCGGILIIIVLLGIFLPRRLRFRLRAYSWRRARPTAAVAQPEPAPVYPETTLSSALLEEIEESDETAGEPRTRIFYRYRLAFRLVQRITRALLKPEQTLREFTRETGRVLGPAGRYFSELTTMVERLLYSQYRATEDEVERSKQLSHRVEEESKPETAAIPMLPSQLQGEGIAAQLPPDRSPLIRRAADFILGGRVSTTGPWRQLSVWLWVLLIVTLVYFAFTLLFLVPLLLMSVAY